MLPYSHPIRWWWKLINSDSWSLNVAELDHITSSLAWRYVLIHFDTFCWYGPDVTNCLDDIIQQLLEINGITIRIIGENISVRSTLSRLKMVAVWFLAVLRGSSLKKPISCRTAPSHWETARSIQIDRCWASVEDRYVKKQRRQSKWIDVDQEPRSYRG